MKEEEEKESTFTCIYLRKVCTNNHPPRSRFQKELLPSSGSRLRTGNNDRMEVRRESMVKREGKEGDFEKAVPGKEGGTSSPGNNKLKSSLANTFEFAGLTCSTRDGRGMKEAWKGKNRNFHFDVCATV